MEESKMENQVSRESYIESELTKWKEKFEIPFEQEFNLKAMLSLQYQFLTLPEDHVKAKADLIHTIQRISGELRLKPIKKITEKVDIVLLAKEIGIRSELFELLHNLLDGKINNEFHNQNKSIIETDTLNIKLYQSDSNSIRGMRADYVYGVDFAQDSPIKRNKK
jgi:hypothetical protein